MKKFLKIVHLDGNEEVHEVRMCDHNGRLDGGITAIGFQFYSITKQNYILVHPTNVLRIEEPVWEVEK